MKESLNIIEWNLNFQSGKEVIIPSFIKDIIKEEDIIIFTEIVKCHSVLQFLKDLNEFNFYESYNTQGNQIIILVRKNFKVTKLITKIPNVSSIISPDLLHVEITIRGVKYQIIGVRIKIGNNKDYKTKYIIENNKTLLMNHGLDEDYKSRKIQSIQIANYISDMNNVIMLGAFNTSNVRGNLDKSYLDVKKEYEILKYNEKKDFYYFYSTRFYNYQMLCYIIGENFIVSTPKNKYSWGLQYINNKFKYGYIKNDHLITSSNICVEKVDYDWSFVEKNKDNYKIKNINKGYPDHAILSAKIKL